MEGEEGGGGHYYKHPRMEDDTSGVAVPVTEPNDDISNLISEQENPMMNDLVLKRLFQLMCPKEVSRARLVCKQWYKRSLPVWLQNGSAIVIKCGKDNANFLKFLEEAHLDPSTTHEDIVGIKQYRKFRLEHHDQIYNRMHFEVFWNECGNYLTHLTLGAFKIPDPVAFKDILFCRFTPNLEYLVVEVDSVGGPPVEPRLLNYNNPPEQGNLKTLKIDIGNGEIPFPLKWKPLLYTYPNLKYFGVGNCLSEWESNVNEIFTAIHEIRSEDRSRLELQSFIWLFNECYHCVSVHLIPEAVSPSTRHAQLPLLETFKYAVSEELPENVLANLLSAYAISLKRLELYMQGPFDCYFGFPQMSQLVTLELTGVPVKDLTFLRKLPNIRSLVLLLSVRMPRNKLSAATLFSTRLFAEEAEADLAEEGITVPSLKEFRCDYRLDCTANDIIGLRRLMPNLSLLGMSLDNISFPLVCRHLTQLEQLTIYGGELGDDGIIGIVAEGKDAQLSNFQPNISRLQNLKSFEMAWGPTLFPNFTKDSVIHGFAKVPLLKKLVINVYALMAYAELQQVVLERIPFVEIRDQDDCFKCGSKFKLGEEWDSEEEEEDIDEN